MNYAFRAIIFKALDKYLGKPVAIYGEAEPHVYTRKLTRRHEKARRRMRKASQRRNRA